MVFWKTLQSSILVRRSFCQLYCYRAITNGTQHNIRIFSKLYNGIDDSDQNDRLFFGRRGFSTSSRCQIFSSPPSYTLNVRPYKITSRLAAEQLVRDMDEDERYKLLEVLDDLEEELLLEQGDRETVPTFNQLWMLAFINSIPFIGFGFLDNAIMILAGEYIDHTLGMTLGISTMAAAAIGNMISDVAGIGMAGYVEVWASRFGFEEPSLTPLQLTMTQSKLACHFGRALGIVLGCIIGMLPLLFIGPREEPHKETNEHGEREEKIP